MIKGKLLWWRSSVVSGITTLTMVEASGKSVQIRVTGEKFRKFYKKVGNPARKFISYENGTLKLEE